MSTEIEQVQTTEASSNSQTTDKPASNKNVFAPLGIYAAVAVIMVSIIVTTAIMLNNELGTVDDNIASIEEAISDVHAADSSIANAEPVMTETAVSTEMSADITTGSTATTDAIVVAAVESTETAAVMTIESTNNVTASERAIADAAAFSETESFARENTDRALHQELTARNQARIESYKLEQKQHMTEMLSRVRALEVQQLDQYKAQQDTQVERLREQIAVQQKMIDSLISRNKELYDLRAAKMQQYQTHREEIINRI